MAHLRHENVFFEKKIFRTPEVCGFLDNLVVFMDM